MEKEQKIKWIWRMVTSVLTACFVAWIFSNSLRPAVESAEQSGSVVGVIQGFFKWIAPNSFIAQAQGDELKMIESVVRTLAHFCEFALLGALCFWTYCSYTQQKSLAFLPLVGGYAISFVDELLQLIPQGRAFEWTDIATDCLGITAGAIFALLVVVIALKIIKKKKNKKTEIADERVGD